ncbi:MAG: hypothetical protein P8182_10780 [Deltaproteobacteria bacterium]
MISRGLLTNVLILLIIVIMPATLWSQGPYTPQGRYPPQGPPPPGAQAPPPARMPQQQPLEYAFRPDLTNPQFGQCLQLESQWKALYQQYYQQYQRARSINPRDPAYARYTYYLRDLKRQLDAAWNNFSGRCVYFPARRQR